MTEAAPSAEPSGPTLRAGQLTGGWRLTTALLWISVVVAWAAVWNTSVQLGLSTWWLGPRGEPTMVVFRLLPFAGPLVVVLGVLDNARWLPYLGIAAGAVFTGYGLGDLGRVPRLGWLEVVIGAIAIGVSVASLTGMLRHLPTEPATLPAPDHAAR